MIILIAVCLNLTISFKKMCSTFIPTPEHKRIRIDDESNVESKTRSSVECDMPTTKIYRFHGSILHKWGERVPVGKDNLLLRECLLKNTNFIEGLVVYAGHESKAMLNNGGPR